MADARTGATSVTAAKGAAPPDHPAFTSDEPTLGALVHAATRDLSALVRSEIELAKTEIKQDVSNGAKGGAMFGAAGFLGVLAVILLSIAAAYGLRALGIPAGFAFLIVAVVYLIVAGILALVGKKSVSRVGPPERTIRTAKEIPQALKPGTGKPATPASVAPRPVAAPVPSSNGGRTGG